MGTTLVAAVIFEDSTLVANVGDSRAYVLEASTLNKVKLKTTDLQMN